jgi:Ubiquitin 3 binding protein But2 C-terminal domain
MLSLSLLALGLGAFAVSVPRETSPCTFAMTAIGEPNGTIVEDTIGENRIGGIYPQGIYYVSGHGLFDGLHHNCLVWPSTSQFQCTQGAGGATNFTLADDGNLMHDASEKWFACPSAGPGNDGSYGIFSDTLKNTTGCESVTLRTGGFSCAALGRPSSSAAPAGTASPVLAYQDPVASTSSAAPTSTASAAHSCPTDISGGVFQFPHLIIPTSSQAPNISFGNSYKAYISPINTTLFSFDLPASAPYSGTCALLFLFPFGSDLDPSAGKYYFSGIEEEIGEKGGLRFTSLKSGITASTTYGNMPGVEKDYGKTQVLPGNNYTIATFGCAGQKALSVASVGGVELDYFQNSAPSPIGVYVVPCS